MPKKYKMHGEWDTKREAQAWINKHFPTVKGAFRVVKVTKYHVWNTPKG